MATEPAEFKANSKLFSDRFSRIVAL